MKTKTERQIEIAVEKLLNVFWTFSINMLAYWWIEEWPRYIFLIIALLPIATVFLLGIAKMIKPN